jgi:DNA mismatch repair protein MutL
MQLLFVNRRPVEHKNLGFHLSRAYEAIAGRGEYPAGIIFIDIEPGLVDVNIHPAKREVRLFDQRYIDSLIYQLAVKALDKVHAIEGKSFSRNNSSELNHEQHEQHEHPAPREDARQPVLFNKSSDIYTYSSNRVTDINDLYTENSTDSIKIFGILSGTYILAEKSLALYIIDFHAAHERIIYDNIISREETPAVQELIFPIVAELSIDEYSTVLDNLDYFSDCGFLIEDFSDSSILIRGVPELAGRADPLSIIKQFFEADDTGGSSAVEIRKKIAASIACRAASMAGDALPVADMRAIAEASLNGTMEKRCPHGRPFVHSIDKNQLERMFKRQ